MPSFAPEFAQFWLPSQGAGAGDAKSDRRDDRRDENTPAQQAALEELAERVSLARSIT